MAHAISEIAQALGAEVLGDGSILIESLKEPADAGENDLALAMKPEFAEALPKGAARAAMLWEGADWKAMGLKAAIVAPRPRMALAGLTRMYDKGHGYPTGIHPTAIIDPTAEIGEGVSIGPFSIISAGAKIGAGSLLAPQVFVGPDSVIGEGSYLHVGARIGPRVTIGARFIGHQNCVVGSDGFSFVTPEAGSVEQARSTLGGQVELRPQSWVRIQSLGAVVIGDDVELGAQTCVDAGTIRPTRIGNGTKIDNLGHVGHNVVIGHDCLFAAFVGIAGSTTIGNNVVFGGRVGLSDNITIGDGVVCGGGSAVLTSVPAGRVMLGYPAVKMDTHLETYKLSRRLPRLFKQVAELQKAVFKSEKND
ncbi:UDP-3-O-(3-hydroxymyristoyl)glucosamine N-acyltransferase [Pseudooceanicola sp. CBS1P-1]|uniref:UDP-3-O-(3-hydroxymyristoyl)glucosamine N-acyltransferase n=1 Tax=Pseudooceanicola albus TaxID=2692189 RepID=A0A6L7G2G0_9RHOB|nr:MULTISPECIES: UDP-3-O-(3-hydroxymyristoyl)glucosamine N-acyltransferase [Pseudooceanicola]MBT9383783.1 UDP-3-O-(3-hydroxymyristoyl)glucosamine N-acyltransferase [Pseudooceanicola endophyticus]MXN17637.1 UDP-3-O-(3-hydroxymyristoyl)glucosamine N-acyltransferase [Pseudooceanicola albus]